MRLNRIIAVSAALALMIAALSGVFAYGHLDLDPGRASGSIKPIG